MDCVPARAVLCVDQTDGNCFAKGVQMNLSTHKSDAAQRAGNGKNLNPDAGDGASRTGTKFATKPVMREEPADEQLLAEYRAGDKTKFAVLVLRYQRELYHFLVRFLGDRAAAEDVFQETFLQVHQSADQFDPSRRFRPWLFTIAANKARDLIRFQQPRR